jgi:predicted Co/Zn/Cd cation transporter (cation efflux family)
MATVLEGMLPRISALLCVLFLWTERFNAKDAHKEMFPVYGG